MELLFFLSLCLSLLPPSPPPLSSSPFLPHLSCSLWATHLLKQLAEVKEKTVLASTSVKYLGDFVS